MGNKKSIYIASKTKHAEKWKALRSSGVNIISTWIDEAGPGESSDMFDLCKRCIQEALVCDAMIVYAEYGDILRGAFIEMGVALSQRNKPIILVGPVLLPGSAFTHCSQVVHADSIDHAIFLLTTGSELTVNLTQIV